MPLNAESVRIEGQRPEVPGPDGLIARRATCALAAEPPRSARWRSIRDREKLASDTRQVLRRLEFSDRYAALRAEACIGIY